MSTTGTPNANDIQFGSVKSSPQLKDGTLRPGQFDGANDSEYILTSEESTADNSPIMMEKSPTKPAQAMRSNSPAPMTGFVTGTSPMYSPFPMRDFPFHDAHTATAIRG